LFKNFSMKKIVLVIPVLFLLLISCNLIDKLTQINLVFDKTITLPSVKGVDLPVNTEIPDVETNSKSTFAVENANKGTIEAVLLKVSELTISTPTNGNFSFLKSITIYMSADNLSEVKVAWQDTIPGDSGNTLTLKTTDADLKEYILKDSINYRVNSVIHKVINSDYSINMHSVFLVDEKILGQ
jgi:hypothetical protein